MNQKHAIDNQERFLRWKEVKELVGISRSHAHALIAEGRFPAPIKLAERASAWLESEVQQWIEERIAQRNSQLKK
ncbi:DNA-binding protein [Bacterioplanes sanyensis]|uniref:helix-turn-helix transcriptional regulator n=1 Tax=Bacterioplanes sanyensis TaxID=1249553 RepID=UPI0016791582|nr:AlpA family transcriptional regulator [Bacterioplanes sanyensis]GGY39212.1 DNA-binding protein [Bacterioplanes sanyensis]